MTDIVERLHGYIAANAAESGADVLLAEAADEIERLRERLDDEILRTRFKMQGAYTAPQGEPPAPQRELDKAYRLLSRSVGWQCDAEIVKAKQAQEIERLRVQRDKYREYWQLVLHDADDVHGKNCELEDEIERMRRERPGNE